MPRDNATASPISTRRISQTLTPLAAALLMVACGGGGDGASSSASPAVATPSDAAPASPVVFSGVAATGAALAGASLRVFGADGGEACSTTTDLAGAYSCSVASASRAPFTVVARLGDQVLFSSAAAATSGTVNVTPLTSLIVSRLSPSGDPAKIVAEIAADPTLVTPARLATRVAEVAAMIAPLTAAAGDSLHPISGVFAANGRGHDKVLDSLQINIRPDTQGASVQITIKVTPSSDEAAPLQIAFKSSDATPPAPTVTIRPEDLVQDGIASLVSNFLGRMSACYALPLAQRLSSVAPGATTVTGDATRIQATECRGLFVDNNPGAYKDSGRLVGSSGSFPGMYRSSSTGAAFDGGNFEYRFANGDLFMTFRSTSTNGVVGHSSLVLRAQDGQLKAIGNRHEYDAGIRPYAVDREFPLQPQYSYFGSGYNMSVANRIDPVTGNPVFAKAIVTTPTGSQITLKPVPGRSGMLIERAGGDLSYTGVEYFAAAYKEASTVGNPAQKETSLVFSSTQRSDDELRAIPDQGVWSVEWVHADSAVPNVRQTYRTTGRAPTLGEIRQMKFAQFSTGLQAAWMARTDVQAFRGLTFDAPSADAPTFIDVTAPDGSDGWVVPEGAQFPLSLWAFGQAANGSSFNDSTEVVSTARAGRIDCSKQSSADMHCDTTTGTGQFAAGGRVWTMELYGRTLRRLDLVKVISFYRLAD